MIFSLNILSMPFDQKLKKITVSYVQGYQPNMGLVHWRVILTVVLEIMSFDFEIFFINSCSGEWHNLGDPCSKTSPISENVMQQSFNIGGGVRWIWCVTPKKITTPFESIKTFQPSLKLLFYTYPNSTGFNDTAFLIVKNVCQWGMKKIHPPPFQIMKKTSLIPKHFTHPNIVLTPTPRQY